MWPLKPLRVAAPLPCSSSCLFLLLQHTKPSPGQPDKGPVLIPVRMGLLGPDGAEMPLKLRG